MSDNKLTQTIVYGLGAMGRPMARNLHKNGLLIGVKNRTEGKAKSISSELGLKIFDNDQAMFQAADSVLTCVSADRDLLDVIDRLVNLLPAGAVVIDSSTVSPKTARKVAKDLKAKGIGFLDAPVSGGVEGAKKGTLSIMIGGERSDYKRASDIFAAIGSQITHMGKVGQGQATKAVNQVMVAGVAQAVCTTLAFAENCNLDLKKTIEVLGAGAAGNWFLDNRGQTMIKDEFNVGFKLQLLLKDLKICQEALQDMDTQVPLVNDCIKDYAELVKRGYGDEDISALIRLRRELFEKEDNDA